MSVNLKKKNLMTVNMTENI